MCLWTLASVSAFTQGGEDKTLSTEVGGTGIQEQAELVLIWSDVTDYGTQPSELELVTALEKARVHFKGC